MPPLWQTARKMSRALAWISALSSTFCWFLGERPGMPSMYSAVRSARGPPPCRAGRGRPARSGRSTPGVSTCGGRHRPGCRARRRARCRRARIDPSPAPWPPPTAGCGCRRRGPGSIWGEWAAGSSWCEDLPPVPPAPTVPPDLGAALAPPPGGDPGPFKYGWRVKKQVLRLMSAGM